MNDLNPIQEEAEAIDRIARTPDGGYLHRYLRRVVESCADFQNDGALHAHNGRRTLARDLMRLMAQGIEGSGGRTADDAILTNAGSPVAIARARGNARRVLPNPAVARFLADPAGYDPDSPDTA